MGFLKTEVQGKLLRTRQPSLNLDSTSIRQGRYIFDSFSSTGKKVTNEAALQSGFIFITTRSRLTPVASTTRLGWNDMEKKSSGAQLKVQTLKAPPGL